MRKMGKHIPGLIVTLVVLITAIVFAVMLLNMKVIPTKFIAVIGLVMLVLIVIAGSLWIMYHLNTNMMPMTGAGAPS